MFYWLFIKAESNQFIILSDEQLKQDSRWILEDDEYELIWDSALSAKCAEQYAIEFYNATKMRLSVIPISLKEASDFVNKYHRHHIAPQGHKFSIALSDGEQLIGTIIAGRPVARLNDDGLTLEITRCCVKEVYKNGISKLYAAVCKVAKTMGYKRVITYTLTEESGISLKASGFELSNIVKGRSWNSRSRARVDKHPTSDKYLWLRNIS